MPTKKHRGIHKDLTDLACFNGNLLGQRVSPRKGNRRRAGEDAPGTGEVSREELESEQSGYGN